MLKHVVVLLLLSILLIFTMPQAHVVLQWILSSHSWISDKLMEIFAGGEAGNIARQLLALLLVPIGAALIPTIIYWIAKRRWFPYFMEIIWVVWLIQTAALVALYQIQVA